MADITPVFTKNNPLEKENYRPVSVLPVVSKIFERIMQKLTHSLTHLLNVFRKTFISVPLGYRFPFNFYLISLIERWKKILDQKGYGGVVLMNLSKAFYTLNHILLLAKLHAYGFDRDSLHSNLSNRYQRTKINKILVCGVKLFLEYYKVLFLVLSSSIII